MKQVIDQLLLLTQTLSGKESIERHDVDLAAISKQLVDDLDGTARVSVHNQGTPLPDSARARLFDPFKEDSRRAGGYGLGLFIVVQAHHGSLEVTSTADAGTTLLVRLPK